MRGGLAHRSGHLGSRQAVLRRGDPICQRLTRHLLSEGMSLDSQASNMVLSPFKRTPPRLPQSQLSFKEPRQRKEDASCMIWIKSINKIESD